MNNADVVITGVGVVSCLEKGQGAEIFWKKLIQSENAIKPISGFKLPIDNMVGGEIFSYPLAKNTFWSNHNKCTQLFAWAVEQALADGKVNTKKEQIGVAFGSILAGIDFSEKYFEQKFLSKQPSDMFLFEKSNPNAIVNDVSNHFGLSGPKFCINTACSSSGEAIGLAAGLIRAGKVKMMIAGGSDILTEFIYRGFHSLGALTRDGKVRPFEKSRTGLAIAEGAGVVILENREHALMRNAKIYGKVAGYGSTTDGYSLVRPHKQGKGLAEAIKMALIDAGMAKEKVDYINAHGTATMHNDLSETKAIKAAFGPHAYNLKVSSIKSMIGHAMGASSVIEAICCLFALRDNLIPATINYQEPDPDCDLDYTPNTAHKMEVNVTVSLSAGFGGQNCALIFTK